MSGPKVMVSLHKFMVAFALLVDNRAYVYFFKQQGLSSAEFVEAPLYQYSVIKSSII